MQLKFKYIAVAAALACAGVAHASDYQGPVTVVDPEFATFAKGSLTGPFDLYWDFSLAGGPWSLTSSVTSRVNGTKDVDFSRVYITDGTTFYDYTQTSFDPSEQWSLAPMTLTSGMYEVHTIGSATGGAAFVGELQITPVPEPETFALMFAGLAAVGFVAGRRRAT
ncbi:MAG: FxDxF family PEP-CTERM protein [Burkholderiales bacterium]